MQDVGPAGPDREAMKGGIAARYEATTSTPPGTLSRSGRPGRCSERAVQCSARTPADVPSRPAP